MQNLAPEYAAAATKVKEVDASIVIGKVDATVEKDLASRFGIQGFPTIKWFVDGEVVTDYSAGRSANEMAAWVKKKTGPPSIVLETVAELETAKEEGISMFGYFTKFEGDEHAAFESLAAKTEDAVFFKTSNAEVAKALGLSSAPAFMVGRNYPEFGFESVSGVGHSAMAGADDLSARLAALLKEEKLPAFVEFSPATANRIFDSGIDHQVIVVAPTESFAEGGALRKDLLAASAATKGKIVLVIAKIDEPPTLPIINFFGLDAESNDTQVIGFLASSGKKYAMPADEKVTAASLQKFAEAVVDGTAPKKFKSAPLPEEPLEDGVTVVTGSTFDALVRDPTKDVLLEVYAPWCGHCKALTPIYAKLAKRFKDIDSVVIAKMDGTENEVGDVEVGGYPTILFFPAEKDAEAVSYDEGGRTLKDLTKFVKQHAKIEYELPKKGEGAEVDDEDDDEAAAAAEEDDDDDGGEFDEDEGEIIDFDNDDVEVVAPADGDEGHDEL